MSRSSVRGGNRLRRTLRRVDSSLMPELKTAMEEGAQAIMQDQIAGAPSDEGDMVREIDYKMGRDGLTSVIGPGARHVNITRNPFDTSRRMSAPGKHALFQFFKAYWYEFGTKGNPERNIPPQPARPFLLPAYDINREWILSRTRRGVRLALERAAREGTGRG